MPTGWKRLRLCSIAGMAATARDVSTLAKLPPGMY
jgi:hypothetical protein